MKAIINGLRYDTDAATKIGEGTADCGKGHFAFWEAALYRTASGRYFLAGKGGPRSPWARELGGGTMQGGEGIIAMTPEEATSWAENHLPINETEAAFSDQIKDA